MSKSSGETGKIFIRGLRLEMFIGIYDHERANKQPVLVDVEATLDAASVKLWKNSTAIEQTVSYEILSNDIRALTAQNHIELLENFTAQIVDLCLADSRITSVRVSAEKPGILGAAAVGVSLTRHRAS